ncbi:TPA: pyocin activator PrtN family protein [Vibrio parahaemolyticus]|uniref:pyocin activator PrtN family protein n=1 Tax=Vibrio parahaemolyticus TaxID=670 RepID=UPI0002A58741|nr:pyocin activator PrtN family protein [Vibrio parahaemolyticus]AGB11006.1 hypothetical protein VPBB_2550 [Vibrio parahaemolyticus BB22OP]MBE4138107.1 hypothetical protein [Vibrio parahaemolyticus]MQF42691.1 hypothetical protein [Vibrio parahaemolyticus]TOZ80013.1 hypothetical protein DXJ97_22605 [Vibrio parahaemolyticus]TOZ99732.1 hypothetical protein DXJ96_22625 [Vibrio parahaemolyticus]
MNTQYALHAVFGTPIIKLSEVSEQFFGMKYATAKAKVNAKEFPIPAFRLHEETQTNQGTKMPLFVSVDDLAAYIDKKREEAKSEWESIYGRSH